MGKYDSMMTALSNYIDKRIDQKYNNNAYSRLLWRSGTYDIVIGSSTYGLSMVWKESGTIKMSIGVLKNKDGTPSPIMVFGAGDGNGNNRGYLEKQTDGLSMYYVGDLGLGEVSYLKLTKDSANLNGYEIFSEASSIGDSYIDSASDWNNKTQNLDLSGDASSMNIETSSSGARIELLDTDVFQQLNSSSQKHGLYTDATFSDLELYYNNSLYFEIFNGITEVTFKHYNISFLTANTTHLTVDIDLCLQTSTPANASDTGTVGTITWDSNYIYICTATDTWRRAALNTW